MNQEPRPSTWSPHVGTATRAASLAEYLRVSPEVQRALDDGRPVVALESTVIAHGLPRPENLDTARACEEEVRAAGAIPATVAVVDGALRVGLDDALLAALAGASHVRKVSTRDVAPVLARGGLGATTVAASVEIAAVAGIHVFSTGGIGGVHRGADAVADDVSADLLAIARFPVCVVCSGVKSILDIPRTLERLETLGVPVVAVGTDDFPAFTTRSSGCRAPYRCDDPREIVGIARLRFAQGGGVVVAQPVPAELAVDASTAERAIATALAHAEAVGVRGGDLTPFLLREIASRDERVLLANIGLLKANAALAARIAGAFL